MRAVVLYLAIGVVVFPCVQWADTQLHTKHRARFSGKMRKAIDEELEEKGYIDEGDRYLAQKGLATKICQTALGVIIWPVAVLVVISNCIKK